MTGGVCGVLGEDSYAHWTGPPYIQDTVNTHWTPFMIPSTPTRHPPDTYQTPSRYPLEGLAGLPVGRCQIAP